MNWVAEIETSLADAINSWAFGCAGESPERVRRSIGTFYSDRPSTIDDAAVEAFVGAMLRRMREIECCTSYNNRTLH
jgi:hypothetical protein